jgi:tetratricopeptide (TPR) repeat protein
MRGYNRVVPARSGVHDFFNGAFRRMDEVLAAAIRLHDEGALGEAAAIYEQILARDPANHEVLHRLGVLRHQQGDHARAIALVGKAVALRPNVPAYHANLAEAYRAIGQFERAAGCCRAALSLHPEYPEALGNLGLALQGMGRREEAADQLRRALELRPDFMMAHTNLGIVLRELGRHDEALAHLRRAVELDPRHAPSLTNLGQMLLERGQAAEALVHCREAVRLQPNLAAMHHNLGNVLRELGRTAEARAQYLEAIRLDPMLATSHAHLGLTLLREGQSGAAVDCLKRAIALAPAEARFPEILGDLHMERRDFAEAIACYERARLLATDANPFLHLSLGWALQEEGRLAEAGEQYQTAFRMQPSSGAVQFYLGGFHQERGELAEAEAAYRLAMRLEPGFVLPLARLATVLQGSLPAADLASLEERAADRRLGGEPRGRLLFAIAQVLDARGEYTRAAAALREANAVTLESRRGSLDYLPADHERFVDDILKRFGPAFFARRAGQGSASRRPVFILGLPRSGTTLIEQVLASHSRVDAAGELTFGRATFQAMPRIVGRDSDPMECVPLLDATSLTRLADQHLEWLAARAREGAERVIDKMPENYLYLGLLAALFPQAAFIHCRRDLRDVALSCWMTDFRTMAWPCKLAHIASRFRQYRRLMDHWRTCLPVPIHDVAYEEAVTDLEPVARRLVSCLGLDWEPACLDFHRNGRPVRTASLVQVRQPVHARSVGRWKHYQTELAELFADLEQF